jgi:hypothetical protein
VDTAPCPCNLLLAPPLNLPISLQFFFTSFSLMFYFLLFPAPSPRHVNAPSPLHRFPLPCVDAPPLTPCRPLLPSRHIDPPSPRRVDAPSPLHRFPLPCINTPPLTPHRPPPPLTSHQPLPSLASHQHPLPSRCIDAPSPHTTLMPPPLTPH